MGEMADYMISGEDCQVCGTPFMDDEASGYPRTCVECGGDVKRKEWHQNVYQDSTGKTIRLDDTVRFRGHKYTIRGFVPGSGACGTAQILFKESVHTPEIPDEISVDLVASS